MKLSKNCVWFAKVKNIDTSGFVKKTDYNTKISETESKIPSISGLTTNSALTAVENKIPDVSSLVKKQIMMKTNRHSI